MTGTPMPWGGPWGAGWGGGYEQDRRFYEMDDRFDVPVAQRSFAPVAQRQIVLPRDIIDWVIV